MCECFLPKLFFSSMHLFSLSPSPAFPVYAVVTRPAPGVWVWEQLEEGMLGTEVWLPPRSLTRAARVHDLNGYM